MHSTYEKDIKSSFLREISVILINLFYTIGNNKLKLAIKITKLNLQISEYLI